jgi:hypothetical protein
MSLVPWPHLLELADLALLRVHEVGGGSAPLRRRSRHALHLEKQHTIAIAAQRSRRGILGVPYQAAPHGIEGWTLNSPTQAVMAKPLDQVCLGLERGADLCEILLETGIPSI